MKENTKFKAEQFGLSQEQLINLFVVKQLKSYSTLHASLLFQMMEEYLPIKKRSRAYFYSTIKKMEKTGTLVVSVQGKLINYSLSPLFMNVMSPLYEVHLKRFVALKKAVNQIINDMNNQSEKGFTLHLSKEDNVFFSRLINVRDLTRYLTLRELLRNEEIHGAVIYSFIKEKYGWSGSDGYFYNILRLMENPQKHDANNTETPLISSRWPDGDSRTQRLYQINENGRQVYRRIEENVYGQLKEVQRFLNRVIDLFGDNENEVAYEVEV